jgi:HlyD family secretion protein
VAPMNGVITYLDAEIGEIAAAQTAFTQGKVLMTISNLSVFEVEVDVDETEIIKVQLAQEAMIEVDAFPDTVFTGEVAEIGNTAVLSGSGTDQSTNFKVQVLFKDTNVSIRPGMSATVDIVTNTRKDAMSVPYGAIVMRSLDSDSLAEAEGDTSEGLVQSAHAATVDEDSTETVEEKTETDGKSKKTGDKVEKKEVKGVFVIRDSKAVFVPVETGIADQKNIEVISGLEADDVVVTGPFRTLRTLKSGDEIETEINKEEKKI